MKFIYSILSFFIITASFSQVGIGNTTPKAQLDISASSISAPTASDGILIPRVTAFPTGVSADQNGMLVFLTTAFASNKVGFYYYDFPSLTWKWLVAGNNISPWVNNNANSRVEIPKLSDGVTNRAVGNEIVATDGGNFGIGTASPTAKFNLVGIEKITSTDNVNAFNENYVLLRNISAATNSFTEIADFNTITSGSNNGNLSFEISLISQHSGGGFSSKYIINANYDDFNGFGWREILPISTTGERGGQIALDIGGSLITGDRKSVV